MIKQDFYILTDPKTKEKSVSFTLLMISFVVNLAAQLLLITGKIQQTGQLQDMMFSFIALYFGRKFTVKGQDFSADKATEITQKVETTIKKESST